MSLKKRFRDLTLQQNKSSSSQSKNNENGHYTNNNQRTISQADMEKYNKSETILNDLLATDNYLRAVAIINQLPRAKLVEVLNQAKINFNKGNMPVLRKRCKLYLQKRFDRKSGNGIRNQPNSFAKKPPRYCVVIDFEATCDKVNTREDKDSYPHEIIEFPAIIVDLEAQNHEENKDQNYIDEESGRMRSPTDLHIVDTFHRYVKPIQYPILTDYCKRLTGIKQEQIDEAEEFPVVLQAFHEFLMKNGLNPNTFRVQATESNNMLKPLINKEGSESDLSENLSVENSDKSTENKEESTSKESSTIQQKTAGSEFFQAKVEKWACVTDGPFDFSKFLRLQCETSEIKYRVNTRIENYYHLTREFS